MGESANLHTKCQKEYNSERSVVANAFGVFSSGSVYKIFNAHFLYVGRGKYSKHLHINIDDVQVLQYFYHSDSAYNIACL